MISKEETDNKKEETKKIRVGGKIYADASSDQKNNKLKSNQKSQSSLT